MTKHYCKNSFHYEVRPLRVSYGGFLTLQKALCVYYTATTVTVTHDAKDIEVKLKRDFQLNENT